MGNIVLIGFMGSGKTTVGKILAERYKMKFVDTDEMIEKEVGLPIPEIFKKFGEPYFREVERKIVNELLGVNDSVISTGGGVVLSLENIRVLRRIGVIFYLHTELQKIRERIKYPSTRPLLVEAEKLFNYRVPLYKKIADYMIEVSNLSPEEVADKIWESSNEFNHIYINAGGGSDIYVMKSGLEKIGKYLNQCEVSKNGIIVTTFKMPKLYLKVIMESLITNGFKPTVMKLPDGEKYKTMDTVFKLYKKSIKNKLDRKSFILALGGGVVGDIAGFVAGTYKRGIPFVQVPTTLLAQVDASIGGKSGINLPEGKNMIGIFRQPKFTFISVNVLNTLPIKEMRNGLAEVVKYGIIADKSLFEYLEKNINNILNYDINSLYEIVNKSAKIKSQIVELDEKEEKGIRTILNYGHTLGHALESVTKYEELTHGEAISLGIIYASRLSKEIGLMPESDVGRIELLLKKIGLPTSIKKIDASAILRAMQLDKKVIEGKLRMVLSKGIGSCEVVDNLDKNLLKKVLRTLYPRDETPKKSDAKEGKTTHESNSWSYYCKKE